MTKSSRPTIKSKSLQQLKKAVRCAAKDHNGKPIFYTVLRHVSRSGMSRVISVHYVDFPSGELHCLNYTVSTLLGMKADMRRAGIRVNGCGMDMGFSLIYDLASAALGDGYAITQRWI